MDLLFSEELRTSGGLNNNQLNIESGDGGFDDNNNNPGNGGGGGGNNGSASQTGTFNIYGPHHAKWSLKIFCHRHTL